MDTEKTIPITKENEDLLDGICYLTGNNDDLSFILEYIEITRHLQEIYQWYQIFNFNLNTLKSIAFSTDSIAINAITISLLSSGKNLIDSMDACMSNTYNKQSKQYKSFSEDILRNEYDSSFSYRFLTRLRNFSQHCHIPVSHHGDYPCFDLMQIYNTPHYHFNATLQTEVQALIEDVRNSNNDFLTLAIAPTVCAYTCSVYKILKSFLSLIRMGLLEKQNNCNQTISDNSSITKHEKHPEYDGLIFYQLDNSIEMLHCFDTTENPEALLIKWNNHVISTYKDEANLLKEIKKSSILL